ncbi:MAG: type II secretion system F family protein [Candidatus Omnitrophica bacterium]|nr:type II secretion system F family protein [Candidatus Omnitrophota bacterium]
MSILIFILIGIVTFILMRFVVLDALVPIMIDRYAKLQEKKTDRFSRQLEESFIFWEKKRLLLLSLSPFVVSGAGFLLFRNIVGLVAGFILGVFVPNVMILIATRIRIKKFQGQLVDSLTMLTSSLKAGLSFVQAMEVLCEEMPPPISQEFNLVLKENKLGVSLDESLKKLRKRMPLEEVNLLVTSILIARESGGELTKVFGRLTDTIRNNIKLKEKIATLTLQGKLQGLVMMVLPFVFTYFVYKQNPDHFTVMLETDMGRMLIILAIVLQIVGIYLIKKISTYRI